MFPLISTSVPVSWHSRSSEHTLDPQHRATHGQPKMQGSRQGDPTELSKTKTQLHNQNNCKSSAWISVKNPADKRGLTHQAITGTAGTGHTSHLKWLTSSLRGADTPKGPQRSFSSWCTKLNTWIFVGILYCAAADCQLCSFMKSPIATPTPQQ